MSGRGSASLRNLFPCLANLQIKKNLSKDHKYKETEQKIKEAKLQILKRKRKWFLNLLLPISEFFMRFFSPFLNSLSSSLFLFIHWVFNELYITRKQCNFSWWVQILFYCRAVQLFAHWSLCAAEWHEYSEAESQLDANCYMYFGGFNAARNVGVSPNPGLKLDLLPR